MIFYFKGASTIWQNHNIAKKFLWRKFFHLLVKRKLRITLLSPCFSFLPKWQLLQPIPPPLPIWPCPLSMTFCLVDLHLYALLLIWFFPFLFWILFIFLLAFVMISPVFLFILLFHNNRNVWQTFQSAVDISMVKTQRKLLVTRFGI